MKRLEFWRTGIIAILGLVFMGNAFGSDNSPSKDKEFKPVIHMVSGHSDSPRIQYGIEQLQKGLADAGWTIDSGTAEGQNLRPHTIRIGLAGDGALFERNLEDKKDLPEGFALICREDQSVLIAGADEAGILYGCLELLERIQTNENKIPQALTFRDSPKLKLRGPCLGLQRPEKIYDDAMYDYPYVPSTFPWLYDRAHWEEFLDLLVRNRFNVLYLWNGHPFTSILKLEKYPEAQEVDSQQLQENIDLFRWLCSEADRRNIWIVQNHYNIHLSHAFARAHNLDFHHSRITPLVADYSRYCYTEFIKNYPHVGLMMCLGEALDEDEQWLCEVVIPAVREGLQPGRPEPPLIIRSHSTDIFSTMDAARGLYSNLYIESKYNNETLASDQLGGGTDPQTDRHYAWERDGKAHQRLANLAPSITNVHCVANLEPFRWGSPDFIQRAVTSCAETGIQGLHLYPLRYWDWPYTADRAIPRLKQINRDWIWFAAWARYSWNPDRNLNREKEYWTMKLEERYGSRKAARLILRAYELSGEVMPQVTRSFAVTTENYLAATLGQTLEQLIQSRRWYNPLKGETISSFAWKRANGQQDVLDGESPWQAADEMLVSAEEALDSAQKAAEYVTKSRLEFDRFLDDMRAIQLVAKFYRQKTKAAVLGLEFLYTADLEKLHSCLVELESSVETYRRLTSLTSKTYMDCAGRHDSGRRYPYPAPETLVWSDVLPKFEQELERLKTNARLLYRVRQVLPPLEKGYPVVPIRTVDENQQVFTVCLGAPKYCDRPDILEGIPRELLGLNSIRYNWPRKISAISIPFIATEPVKAFIRVPDGESPPRDWEHYRCSASPFPDAPGQWFWKDFPAGESAITLDRRSIILSGFTRKTVSLLPESQRRIQTNLLTAELDEKILLQKKESAAPESSCSSKNAELDVLSQTSHDLLFQYLLKMAQSQFDQRKKDAQAALQSVDTMKNRQQELKKKYQSIVESFPEKTPLNPEISGAIPCEGYRIEKLIFESRPSHHVTANLYIPSTGNAPFPGILFVCGHEPAAKAGEAYQSACILLVKNGFAVLSVDPVCQGERYQSLLAADKPATRGGTTDHTLLDVGSLLVGRDVAGYELWDNIRALDYLCSRPEVDPQRIGLTGNSGGGTQTMFLMAWDERVAVAAPSCFITGQETVFPTIGPQDGCQLWHNEGPLGIDHADFIAMRAPKPTKILAAEQDFFDIKGTRKVFEEAQQVYTLLGSPDAVEMFSCDDKHGFSKPRREQAVQWMRRWFYSDPSPVVESEPILKTEKDLRVTKTGQVLSSWPDERTLPDLNLESAWQLAAKRKQFQAENTPDKILETVKKLLGLPAPIPQAQVQKLAVLDRTGYTIEKWILSADSQLPLPSLLFVPGKQSPRMPAVLYVDSRGKAAEADRNGMIEQLVRQGNIVLAVDLRGYGETLDDPAESKNDPKHWNAEYRNAGMAFYVGYPLVGQRTVDILMAFDVLSKLETVDPQKIQLIASGQATIPALHAAAIRKGFSCVTLRQSIQTWLDLVKYPLVHDMLGLVVPEALQYYDLPDLQTWIAPTPVIHENPVSLKNEIQLYR